MTGGLLAFLLIIGRTFTTRTYSHDQAAGAVVTSYYWHFVDVVWIALFATIYLLRVSRHPDHPSAPTPTTAHAQDRTVNALGRPPPAPGRHRPAPLAGLW